MRVNQEATPLLIVVTLRVTQIRYVFDPHLTEQLLIFNPIFKMEEVVSWVSHHFLSTINPAILYKKYDSSWIIKKFEIYELTFQIPQEVSKQTILS